jgi:hypothetical protein
LETPRFLNPCLLATSELSFDARNGETYFVDVQVAFSGGPGLVRVQERDARTGIKANDPPRRLPRRVAPSRTSEATTAHHRGGQE